ncbi:hypothetical protein CJ030_MR3G001921 [Morella rubra]|uniref:AIR9-like A9 domain-containing protein n=1 Tax=Morella rubra TaxID=262757 RepID=A0A6A1W480_9ROSI|nr:hypothetical protein CJ030_MR3G001921 [Morella rubra]
MTYSNLEGPGIENFQIIGDAVPGGMLLGCGYPVRGTSLCMFQWVRHLQDGTGQYIEGATNPEYVVTVDDVDKLIAVDCIPMDDKGHQGELVRLFANHQNKIKCDPEMQSEIDTHFARGKAKFSVLLLMGKFGVVWMVNISDKLMNAGSGSDFSSKFSESSHGFLAQRCVNIGGWYVVIVEYGRGRKVRAVMGPEGRYAYGWQILNRVFQEAVSHFNSLQLKVVPLRSPSIRPDVSFAAAVKVAKLMVGDDSRSGVEFGNGVTCAEKKEDVTSSDTHAKLEAAVSVPNFCILNEADSFCQGGELTANVSGSDVLVNLKDVWAQLVGLRSQVDKLEKLVIRLGVEVSLVVTPALVRDMPELGGSLVVEVSPVVNFVLVRDMLKLGGSHVLMSGVAMECSLKLGGAPVPCGLIRSSLGLSRLVPDDSRVVAVLQSGSEVASELIDYVVDEISCNSRQGVTVFSVMLLGMGFQVGFGSQFSVGGVVLIGDANIVKYVGVEVFFKGVCWEGWVVGGELLQ